MPRLLLLLPSPSRLVLLQGALSLMLALSVLASCSDGAGVGDGPGSGVDASTGLSDVPINSRPGSDAGVIGGGGDGTGSGTGGEAGAGELGAPCNENADCNSGYCVEGPDGDVCTKHCDDSCPDGWVCKGVQDAGPDVVFLCIPVLTDLCTPCQTDGQCNEGQCRIIDGGKYCAAHCEPGVGCPTGYWCESDGAGAGSCLPETASCSCRPGQPAFQRACSIADRLGECPGVQTCDPEAGWGQCSAASPTSESCNFLDDDCDGQIDENYKTDGLYQTLDHCGSCNISCTVGFPNAASTECVVVGDQPQCQVTGCAPGYVQLNPYQCVPEGASLCQPCADDSACLGVGAACVTLAEGGFCGQSCEGVDDCPEGYACEPQGNAGLQCVPATGSCTCSGSNTGLARSCVETWVATEPGQPSYTCAGLETCTDDGWGPCEVPVEDCDGLDNDCDGEQDEDFRDDTGAYAMLEHCGGCGISCQALEAPHSDPFCSTSTGKPQCDYSCIEGWVDVDGVADNGCECLPKAGIDVPDETGTDSNCDGIDGEITLGVFVSKAGSDNAAGTIASPVKSLQAGIDKAAATGKSFVYVATGAYVESIALAGGVGVYGGYSADFGVRDATAYETALIAEPFTQALPGAVNAVALGHTAAMSAVFDGFTVFGADADAAGGTSYAIFLKNPGAHLEITHNEVIAGDGAEGADGGAGDSGEAGDPGNDGVTALHLAGAACTASHEASGGASGKTTCGGVTTHGGKGGTRICPNAPADVKFADQSSLAKEHGKAGSNNAAGAGSAGLAGWDSMVGASTCGICSSNFDHNSDGLPGGDGSGGGDGGGAGACSGALGGVAGGLWQPAAGGGGGDGTDGGGGGGGGAGGGVDITSACSWVSKVVGASGGGGGAGGCGGDGGSGAGGGGGSFGVFVSWSGAPAGMPVIASNTIRRGRGGDGGTGGAGGFGGAPGVGGAGGSNGGGGGEWPINVCGMAGGYGGNGGHGGHGAGGAGGCGGVSYGIYLTGTAGVPGTGPVVGNAFPGTGAAGAGGAGGASAGTSGPNGLTGVHTATNF